MMARRDKNIMSVWEFMEYFGTEKKCKEHLFNARFSEGFVCPKCGHTHGTKIKTRNSMQCANCDYQLSAICGTVMEDSKLPIKKWYYAMYLVTVGKRGISAKELQKHIKVTYKTAWYLLKRIRESMGVSDEKYILSGVVAVDEAYFTGKHDESAESKAGRGNNKSKVLVCVSHDQNGHPLHVKMKVVEDFTTKTIGDFLHKNIEKNSILNTDGYVVYRSETFKADYKHEYEVGHPEDENSKLKWLHILIGNAKSMIQGTYHGLDKQELQSYLNEFCYRFNRRFIADSMFEKLISATFITKPLFYYGSECKG